MPVVVRKSRARSKMAKKAFRKGKAQRLRAMALGRKKAMKGTKLKMALKKRKKTMKRGGRKVKYG